MTRLRNIKVIFADWSGVISDDRRPVYEAGMRVLAQYGMRPVTFDWWLAHTQAGSREFFASMGLTQNPDILFEEFKTALAILHATGIHPIAYADAYTFLQKISESKKVIVVSTHPQENLLAEAKAYGLHSHVAQFIGGTKNKAFEIKTVLARLNIPAAQSLFLGDMTYDLQAGKQAGVTSVGITTGYHTKAQLNTENPDLIVDSLSELLQHLL